MRFAASALRIVTAAMLAATGAVLITPAARAEISITIDRGNFQPLPIAITDFGGTEGDLGAKISGVITNDLKRSGVFAPIDKKAFIDQNVSVDAPPQFDSWKVINAQALVTG